MIPFFQFTDGQALAWFFRAFTIIMTLFYILYSTVLLGQVRSLSKAVRTDGGMFMIWISLLQLFLAVTLFFLAIIL